MIKKLKFFGIEQHQTKLTLNTNIIIYIYFPIGQFIYKWKAELLQMFSFSIFMFLRKLDLATCICTYSVRQCCHESAVSAAMLPTECATESARTRERLSLVTEELCGCCQQQITAATQHPPLSAACWATCCAAAIESTYTQPQIQIQIQWHARADTLRLRRTTKTRTQATERLTVACGQAARLDVTKPRESNAI